MDGNYVIRSTVNGVTVYARRLGADVYTISDSVAEALRFGRALDAHRVLQEHYCADLQRNATVIRMEVGEHSGRL